MMSQRMLLGRPLSEHIGGRWAISWQAYLVNAPVSAASVLTVITLPASGAAWLRAVAVMLVGLAVIAAFFIIADRTFLRHRREHPVPVWWVAVLGAGIGVTRALAVNASAEALGISASAQTAPTRWMWAGILGAIMLPLGALLLSSIAEFRNEHRRLLTERAEAERHVMEQEGVLETLTQALAREVEEEVRRELASLPDDELDARSASEAVRRASHRLWERPEPRQDGGTGVWRVLRIAMRHQSIPAFMVAVVWAVAAVPTILTNVGGMSAVVDVIASVAAIWATLAVTNRLTVHHPRGRIPLWVAGVLGAAFLTGPVAFLVFDPRPLSAGPPMFLSNLLWLGFVTAVLTVGAGAVVSGERMLAGLSRDIDDDEVRVRALEAESARMTRELAARLHGSMHSPIVTRAALLAGAQAGEGVRERLLDSVGRITLPAPDTAQAAGPSEAVLQVIEPWRPLVGIHVEVEPAAASAAWSTLDLRSLERLVEEAVANAYRHGGATMIEIRLAASDDAVTLSVVDDGSGLPAAAVPGLGMRLLESVAPGGWSLGSGLDGRTRLVVPIPVGMPRELPQQPH